jgi:hypothetical protein
MRLRRHETFRISTAKKEPKPKKTDHDKVKQNIVQIKHQIDELEKKFKSFLVLKKRQDANIGLKGMLEDPLSIEEMIQKAKANLSTFKTQKQNQNEDKTKSDQIIEDNLAKGTMETREWYRKRKLLIQAGPKFLRHTYSPFGNVILVSALTEFSFAVFSSRNTLELWEKVGQEFELKEAFEIPGTAILTALELYHQEMLKEVDYLADIPDAEDYLVGVRQADSSQDTTKNGSMANKLNESTSLLQQAPFRDRKLIQRTDLNRLAAQQVSNGGKSIDWDHYPFKTVPIVHHRHCYFLGYESGEAAIFEMITMYNPATKQMSYKAQVRLKKRISYTPVKLAFLYYLPDGIPIIATEISVKSGEGLVQGLQLNFEREWTCKCDMIRLTMMDKCTRYVNRDQPVDLDDNDLPRAPEEPIITAYAYDEVHMSILMGTSFGVLIRFFYQRDKKKGDDDGMRRPDSPASITSSLEPSLPGKLVYCLSTTPVAQEMVKEDSQGPPVSVIDSKGELLNAPLKVYLPN